MATLPGVPRTWVAGDVLTAAQLNTEVRDSLSFLARLGEVAYAEVTSNQTGITTIVDITGLTVTFTRPAGRRLKVTMTFPIQASAAGTRIDGIVADGANTILKLQSLTNATANLSDAMVVIHRFTSTGASQTIKGRVQRGSGTGTILVAASGSSPADILIEDIGPV